MCEDTYIKGSDRSGSSSQFLILWCKGSGFSKEHTVKHGKYDVYNLHARLSLVAKQLALFLDMIFF